MSKLRMIIQIDFIGGMKDREPLCVEIEMDKKNPSDEEIADLLRNEVIEHFERNEK